MLPAHVHRTNGLHRQTHSSSANATPAPPLLHSRSHPAATMKPTTHVPGTTCQALPDPHSFSSLGQDMRVVIEAWPGLQNVTSASAVQPLLDALHSAAATAGSTGEHLAALDPAAAATLADLSSNFTEGASPHMGSTAAMAAVDSLSSWAAAALGSTQDAAAGFAGTALDALPRPTGSVLPPEVVSNVEATLGGLRSAVQALGSAGSSASPNAGAVLNALASALTSLTATLGSLLDGSAPPVDMGRLMAGMAASMSSSGGSTAGHGALLENPVVATLSVASLMVVAAIAEALEAQRGLSEADADSREAAMALMQAERATQARATLLKDGCYCPERLAGYFENRPVLVAKRAAQVAAEAAGFGVALAMDFATDTVERNEKERAAQMRGVIERLGPAYVKVAQALSTRVDLLRPAYFEQIQMLQDRVPPFPTSISRTVLEASLGRPVDAMFEMLSDRPVAAASLGQVYYGVLRPEYGGREVAVKVQRPGVLEAVALDLMLIRSVAVAIQSQSRVDWAGIIDAWALRFFHEMDYSWEARAMNIFSQQMAPLKGIKVTQAVEELCSDEVLTTDWIRGEKLSESDAPDVRELCNSLLNAYLVQLLETGFLHADPHPGNLMRSDDGRLVILDFGLMTEVTVEQREALVSYIAHLINEDWAALAYDLQALGFIPKDVDPTEAGLVEPLGKIMKQLTGGGGAAKVNIDKVVDDLDRLGQEYPLEIPPFFALILRAFSVIEGIALGVDPDYAIVKECFPYLSRRLLNDDSPRTRQLLREVLYGRQGRKRLDIERLTRFAEGLSAYTTDGLTNRTSAPASSANSAASPPSSSSPADPSSPFSRPNLQPQSSTLAPAQQQPNQTPPPPTIDPALREALLVVFSRKGSYIQELLVDELVAAADALSREASSALLRSLLASFPLAAAQTALNGLGPMRPLLVPLPTPVDVLKSMAPVVAVTEEDREALQVVRGILSLAAKAMPAASSSTSTASAAGGVAPGGGVFGGSPSLASAFGPPSSGGLGGRSPTFTTNPRALRRVSEEWSPFLAELLPGVAYTGELFVRALLSRVASRLSQGLAGTSTLQQQPSYMAGASTSSNRGSMSGRTSSSSSGGSRNGSSSSNSRNGSSSSNSSSSSSSSTTSRNGVIDIESAPSATTTVPPELISNNSSSGQTVPLKPTSALKEGKKGSSSTGESQPLPRGKYAPYSPPGASSTSMGASNGGRDWTEPFLNAAEWVMAGGARIAAARTPVNAKPKSKK
eukprot:CAMPEP_0202368102 /NCGR_PEP_ID=MMETSP1127-20130417/294_1 /ASSEMBLY_ACC=CAM_ASM_000462 /TAXON_ID=3047 /ORGANISM="Dunaliella tertiolecta, Strain CCMP1320" /LENGTH=1245 /DNA_ID=CAMNT_0048963455 /DNA_START=1 /DNA_END=3738 /DNA_ORIENTATION=+